MSSMFKKLSAALLMFFLVVSVSSGLIRILPAASAAQPDLRVAANNDFVNGNAAVSEVPGGHNHTTGGHIDKSLAGNKLGWARVGGAMDLSAFDRDKITLELWIHMYDFNSLEHAAFAVYGLHFALAASDNDWINQKYMVYSFVNEGAQNVVDGWNHISIRFSKLNLAAFSPKFSELDLRSVYFQVYAPMFDNFYMHDVFIKETDQLTAFVNHEKQPKVFPLTGLSLDITDKKIKTGTQIELKAARKPGSANDLITWSSSDNAVATVNASGTVTGVSEGVAIISASVGLINAKMRVTVADVIPLDPRNNISFDIVNGIKEAAFEPAESLGTHSFSPGGDGGKTVFAGFSFHTLGGAGLIDISGFSVEYAVLRFNVFIMDKTKLLRNASGGFAVGNAIHTGTLTNNCYMQYINNTLYDGLISGWNRVSIKLSSMVKNGSPNMKAVSFLVLQAHTAGGPEIGFNDVRVLETEQTENIVVDNKIPLVPVESLEIPKEATLNKGKFTQIIPDIKPADATFARFVTYESSNPSVAYVSQNGTVSARGAGTATVSVRIFGLETPATMSVTVTDTFVKLNSISISQSSYTGKTGSTVQLAATLNPGDATDSEILWYSSDTAVASVGADGLVTIVGKGKAVIYAVSPFDNTIQAKCDITESSFKSGNAAIIAVSVVGGVLLLGGGVLVYLLTRRKKLSAAGGQK